MKSCFISHSDFSSSLDMSTPAIQVVTMSTLCLVCMVVIKVKLKLSGIFFSYRDDISFLCFSIICSYIPPTHPCFLVIYWQGLMRLLCWKTFTFILILTTEIYNFQQKELKSHSASGKSEFQFLAYLHVNLVASTLLAEVQLCLNKLCLAYGLVWYARKTSPWKFHCISYTLYFRRLLKFVCLEYHIANATAT